MECRKGFSVAQIENFSLGRFGPAKSTRIGRLPSCKCDLVFLRTCSFSCPRNRLLKKHVVFKRFSMGKISCLEIQSYLPGKDIGTIVGIWESK